MAHACGLESTHSEAVRAYVKCWMCTALQVSEVSNVVPLMELPMHSLELMTCFIVEH